jgi:hypothetical protein
VTNNMDNGAGSLRAVLAVANNGDTIKFSIGNGVQVIALNSPLAPINVSVTIDGTTQPGYTGVRPLIEIDGNNSGGGNGLSLTAGNSTVRALSIVNFAAGDAVRLSGPVGNTVVDACFLGVDPNGIARGNAVGVHIVGSPKNTIGAIPFVAGIGGDLISGNDTGVRIEGSGSQQNVVASDFIGTDPLGGVSPNFGNTGDGVWLLDSASQNTIGGNLYTDGNLISGNGGNGVRIDFNSSGNFVLGNDIGLNVNGNAKLPNGGDGVFVEDGSNNNIIGGNSGITPGGQNYDYGNIISGNTGNGVRIDTDPNFTFPAPDGTQVLGNWIGLGSDGSTALGNGQNGVLVANATNTLIGSGNATEGNVISGNSQNGIGVNSAGTKIFGNYIGTDATGLLTDRGNQGDGIQIHANQTQVGQSGANSRNVISGNVNYGVDIFGNQNFIQNNYIGLCSDGSTPVGNKQGGVIFEYSSTNNTIGGATRDLGNVISGNKATGTGPLFGNGITLASGSSVTTVGSNYIGTDANGTGMEANAADGIYIQANSTGNIIGLEVPPGQQIPNQVISGNGRYGIEVDGADNTIDFNLVGLGVNFSAMANGIDWRLDNGAANTWGEHNIHNP